MKKLLSILIIILNLNIVLADKQYNIIFPNIINDIKKNSKEGAIWYTNVKNIKLSNNKIYYNKGINYINSKYKKIKIYIPGEIEYASIIIAAYPNTTIRIYHRFISDTNITTTKFFNNTINNRTGEILEDTNRHIMVNSGNLVLKANNISNFNGGWIYLDLAIDPKNPIFPGENNTSSTFLEIAINLKFTNLTNIKKINTWIKNTKFYPTTKLPLIYIEKINYEMIPNKAGSGKITGYFTPAEYSSDGSYLHFDSIEDYPDNGILIKGNSIETCKQNIENKNYNLGNKKNKIINIGENIVKKYDKVKLEKIVSVLNKFSGENGIISLLRDYFSCKIK